MQVLLIGPEQQEIIDGLVERARLNPISLDDMRNAANAQGEALMRWKRRLNDYTTELPVGYLVTYTREQQAPGLCHHISISIDTPGMIATSETIAMICTAFQMDEVATVLSDPSKAKNVILGMWPEEYPSGRVAVNIVALVRRPPPP